MKGAKNPVVVKFADSQKDKDARKSRDMPNRGGSMGGGFGGPVGASGGVGGSGAFGPGGGNNSQYAQVRSGLQSQPVAVISYIITVGRSIIHY